MPDNLILIAVCTDRDEVSLPVRGILDALSPTHGAHILAKPVGEVTANDYDRLRAVGIDLTHCGLDVVGSTEEAQHDAR